MSNLFYILTIYCNEQNVKNSWHLTLKKILFILRNVQKTKSSPNAILGEIYFLLCKIPYCKAFAKAKLVSKNSTLLLNDTRKIFLSFFNILFLYSSKICPITSYHCIKNLSFRLNIKTFFTILFSIHHLILCFFIVKNIKIC